MPFSVTDHVLMKIEKEREKAEMPGTWKVHNKQERIQYGGKNGAE